jgi:RHS repeat-associated protein
MLLVFQEVCEMKKILMAMCALVMVVLLVVPGRAEGVWTPVGSQGTQFAFNGELITITHTTVPDGLDYIERTFTTVQEVSFEFDAKIGSVGNNSDSLVIESNGGENAGGLWLYFKANTLYDRDVANGDQLVATVAFDQWTHFRINSTRDKISVYVNGKLKYERAGTFQPRNFLRFRDYGRCAGAVINYLNNVQIIAAGSAGPHGTEFITDNNQVKIVHSTADYGFDEYQMTFPQLQDIIIDFDAKIGSLHNDNFSLLMDFDGEEASDGLRLAFNRDKLCYFENNQWREIATVNFDRWTHYRVISTLHKIEIYVDNRFTYSVTGTFRSRSRVKFKDFGLCSGRVINWVSNFQTKSPASSDFVISSDNFDFGALKGWSPSVNNGTEFSQSGNTIRIIHAAVFDGFDNIQQTFTALPEAVFEFDAKLGSVNNDGFTLLFESDGGYEAGDGLGLAFKENQVMVYEEALWRPVFTVPFHEWRHYRVVSTTQWVAVYINDDLKYKMNGNFRPRSFMKFSDFGRCSGSVVNYLANIRVRPVTENDRFITFIDFNQSPLDGWDPSITHGTQFSQSGAGIQIVHSTWPNGFDHIQQSFGAMEEAVFEFDAKLGAAHNDNFSLLVESDGGYAAADGLGLAFKENKVMIYANDNWQEIFTVPYDQWRHYRIVSTPEWVSIYVNDDLKYKRNGNFRVRSFLKFSDFGLCSGSVTNYLANIKIRPATPSDKFILFADFNNQPLTGWDQSAPYGTEFTQTSNGIRIVHSRRSYGFDHIKKTFTPLPEAVFEFDAKIGSPETNDSFSLLLESDGGYNAPDGLGLAFQANQVMLYTNNNWREIFTVPFNEWRHYRVVSTPQWLAVYINDDLKFKVNGSFRSRSFIKFSDFGLCSGTVINYLANVQIRAANDNDKFIIFDDFDNGSLTGWTVNTNLTQFSAEDGKARIVHANGTWGDEYMQRNFEPTWNVALEFDAYISSANDSHSLALETDDSPMTGFNLSFYIDTLYANTGGLGLATPGLGLWNHFRVVFSATRIEVYVNGELAHTFTGNYGPRSYFRFSNAGYVNGVTNYIDNVCIRPLLPEADSDHSPGWRSDWITHTPDGTHFIQTEDTVAIHHALGTPGADYYQRSFKPLQNVAFEFEAKINSIPNAGRTLIIESDGAQNGNGLYLAFNQGTFEGYFGEWRPIGTIAGDEWNKFRIVSTQNKLQVYINGILKYTVDSTGAGTAFSPRSYLRFSNGGDCEATNYIRNISIVPLLPDATITNHPDWSQDWLIHNPEGTRFIQEDGMVKIQHVGGTWGSDYLQRNFEPALNVALEFDAKISSANSSHSLVIESDDTPTTGFNLSFYLNTLYAYTGGVGLATPGYDLWNHFQVAFSATKIEVFVNGELVKTFYGSFNPRSFFRFSNAGYVNGVTTLLDNVCIRAKLPEPVTDSYPDWTSDWTPHTPNGTQFVQDNDVVAIHHVPGTEGAEYLERSFYPLQNVAFEFDAKIDGVGNTGRSLVIESDGGQTSGGLYLAFNQNTFEGFFGNWTPIQSIQYNVWHHYRIVSTQKKVQVYVDGVLRYTWDGTFNPRGFLRFSNGGQCVMTNYIRNISIQPVVPEATIADESNWGQDWVIHNPEGTRFIRENDLVRIHHVGGTWGSDYLQRNFEPALNVALEFDAKISSANSSHSLVIESDDTPATGFNLSFYANTLYAYTGGIGLATPGYDLWNHFRLVFSATKIEVYVNGDLVETFTGNYHPRSFFRFSNAGYVDGVDNYIDNVSVRTLPAQANSSNPPEWYGTWVTHNPEGTQFTTQDNLVTVKHALGTQGGDYYQRSFKPLQNVAFEFEAKLGAANNSEKSLVIESDGGQTGPGLYLAFNQNTLEGYFGQWVPIQTINYGEWNHYRIESTQNKLQVYVNGVLKYTVKSSDLGTAFDSRGYLRFSNYGLSAPVNFIRNITIFPIVPDATITNHPDWDETWVVHNPQGTRFIRENDLVRIEHAGGNWGQDYLQRSFAPRQNVILEFDAKISSANGSHSLVIESDDSQATGFNLSFYQNTLYANTGGAGLATPGYDLWNHYRVEYTRTEIKVYVNKNLVYTVNGLFEPRSYFRFSNAGYVNGVSSWLDNVCIREYQPEPMITHPAGLSPDWIMYHPDGTSFSAEGDTIKIEHALGTWGNDYIQRNFTPVQDVVFEFDLKLGELNNSSNSLNVESDEGSGTGGLYFGFCQNSLRGYFGGLVEIAQVEFDRWNNYRIISTATEVRVYINGEWKYTFSGSFYRRSFLRFSNAGACAPTNYLANIRVTPLGCWQEDWYFEDLDTVAPLLVDILPADNSSLNTATVTVSGRAADTTAVTVTVNGTAAPLTNNYFQMELPVSEGWNTLVIAATDAAANTTSVTHRVSVDSQPPLEFTPVADLSGWTQNNRPVITFGTSDTGSGMDHYEIRVGDGPWVTPVTSPYQFAGPLPDGEQTITVKAMDLAGNIRLGTVTVYIDTTPPVAPEEFEVIPGVGRVILKWKDAPEEVAGYRIERTPVFDGESIRELVRSETAPDLSQYIDEAVVDGGSYTYTIIAIDRAGNCSAIATGAAVTVGVAQQPVTAAGATVKFDQMEVALAKDSITVAGTIVIEEYAEPLPENTYGAAVGRVYDLTLEDQNGDPVETEFTAPVTLTISYAGIQLPQGYGPGDLGIYWYNEENAAWEKLEGVSYDFLKQTLSVPLHHFSAYQAMASQYVSPSLQSYYDLGVSPYGSYFQDNVESVSPASGALSISATDLKIPGPNGFDLVIRRLYDSNGAQQECLLAANEDTRKSPIDTFGHGWSLNIPWIERSDKGEFIRLPEGQTIKIKWSKGKFEYHRGMHFTLYKIGMPGINFSAGSGNPMTPLINELISKYFSGHILILKDGTKYFFDSSGRARDKIDPSGHYRLGYIYNGRKLTEIADLGQVAWLGEGPRRKVTFEYYTESPYLIKSITSGGRTWEYIYSTSGYLKEAYDPLERKTVYGYEPKNLSTGYTYFRDFHTSVVCSQSHGTLKDSHCDSHSDENKIRSFTVAVINRITYPTNATSTYTYEVYSQGGTGNWDRSERKDTTHTYEEGGVKYSHAAISYLEDHGNASVAGNKVVVKTHTLLGKTTTYTYDMNQAAGSLDAAMKFIGPNTYMQSCRIEEKVNGVVIKSTQENYVHLIKSKSYELMDANQTAQYFLGTFPQNIPSSEDYRGQLTTSRFTTVDGQEVEKVALEYNLPIQAVDREIHYKCGQPVYEVRLKYSEDNWGNLTYRIDGSTNLVERWTYYPLPTIFNLVLTKTQINPDPLTGKIDTVTTTYQYNPAGRPTMMTVTDGTTSRTTSYTYDTHGNLETLTEDNGLVTEMAYDSCFYPLSKTLKGVKNANDVAVGDMVTGYQYDPATGMKLSETDARGYTTRYEYDALNRITRVVLPAENGTTPERSYAFDDTNNTCLYTNEKGQTTWFKFDGLGRLYEIVKNKKDLTIDPKVENVTTRYEYDPLGRIVKVTDPRNKATSYTYDSFNRVETVTFPRSNTLNVIPDAVKLVVKLDYQDATNTVVIEEYENRAEVLALIGKTTETSDWANRLVKAIQWCKFGNETPEEYNWSFAYDSLGNKLQQVDPKKNQVNQIFDGLGRMTRVLAPEAELWVDGIRKPAQPEFQSVYDPMGNKTAEIDARGNRRDYGYDLLGRQITVAVSAKDIFTGETMPSLTKTFYDKMGNKARVRDANGKDWFYTYSARGWLLAEKDPEGNVTRYGYDALGNKISMTTAQNQTGYEIVNGFVALNPATDNRTYTTWYLYDELNRLVRTVLPDETPPSETDLQNGNYDNPYLEYTYDANGNKLTEQDLTGLVTEYSYTPRNQVETVKVGGQLQATYTYDAKGNPVEVKDALNKVTRSEYDTLGRLRRVVHPSGIKEGYKYDSVGNRVEVTDGRLNSTRYDYNSLGWVTMVWDPLLNFTQYQYDSNGNQRKQIAANGLETTLRYDEQNRVNERVDSLGNSVKYSYDLAGNLKQMQDARGSMWSYAYRDNQWLDNIQVVNGTESYWVRYAYDRAGNRTQVEDPGNINNYTYDILGRLTGVERNFDNGTYTTGYQYTQGLLTGIRYPETTAWLEYRYNGLNQLNEVVGFTEAGGIQYQADGALQSVAYANGVVTGYNYDEDRRLQSITAALGSANMLNLVYSYDDAGNIKQINDQKHDTTGNLIRTDIKVYEYDKNNQLTKAVTPGTFMENQPTSGTVGLAGGDFSGTSWLEFGLAPQAGLVCLDYNASSIGVDFGRVAPGVKKILLVPGAGYGAHRITEETFDVYGSNDNSNYSLISRDDWEYGKDEQGVITITFKQAKAMRYLKIHVWYDERNAAFFLLQDKATFLNQLGKMLQVYQEATSRTEEYEYDAAGNRKLTRVTLVQAEESRSWYYENSDRLKTDGKYLFSYDNAGNLVKKEKVNLEEGESAEIWDYKYDLLNRLVEVKKNGTLISEYGYDPEGLRVVKKAHGETIHYVFEGTEPIFEKNVTTGKVKSYVYALGKHLARVDGVLGDPVAKKYWYSTDHLGSVRVVTDDTGAVVFQADHLAFGQRFGENKIDSEFEEDDLGFTGKGFDADTGLYYFNARWYDADTGRFISEDPAMDPNNPNLYSYCANNPLINTDPTGLKNDPGDNDETVEVDWEAFRKAQEDRQKRYEELSVFRLSNSEILEILNAESTIPGFKYDPALTFTQNGRNGITLENQIQMWIMLSNLEADLQKDGLTSGEVLTLEAARLQLIITFQYLNIRSLTFGNRFYTSSEIDTGMMEVEFIEFLVLVGVAQEVFAQGANAWSRMRNMVRTQGFKLDLQFFASVKSISKPSDYLTQALKKQGLNKAPNFFKEKWSMGGYDYEVRIHPANPKYGKSGNIYRVARRKQGVDANGQGYGWEYIDENGYWHHTSTLNPNNSGYNDQAAKDTHIQLP